MDRRRVRLTDVRAGGRILQECIDVGHDPVLWREHFVEQTNRLVGAEAGISFLIPQTSQAHSMGVRLAVVMPNSGPVYERLAEFLRPRSVVGDPMSAAIMSNFHRPFTRRRHEMVDDETWYGSDHYQRHRKPADHGDILHSHFPIPKEGLLSVLGYTRPHGVAGFAARDARLIHIIHAQLCARFASTLPPEKDAAAELSPRLQELAVYLRGPMSEKQIAERLNLSRHTVHNYTKTIYKKLAVQSRSELVHKLRARDVRKSQRHELSLI